MNQRLARLLVQKPRRVLAIASLLTLALLPLVLQLRLDTDMLDLFPRRSAESEAFARFSRKFVADQLLMVLVESDDAARLTEFADRYAEALAKSPLVVDVRHRLSAEAGRFLRDHLLQLLGDDEIAALAERSSTENLRARAKRLRGLLSAPGGSSLAPILTLDPFELLPLVSQRLQNGLPVDAQSGYFRSADGKALLLYVRPRAPARDPEADRAMLTEASQLAEKLGARVAHDGIFRGGLEVGYTGAVSYVLHYRDWLHRDTMLSLGLSAAAVLLLFAVFFRALRVLPLVGVPLLVGLLWTAAAAVLVYHRVNAVSTAFGTLLLAIGIDLPIQIYNRLREELRTREPLDALETTVRELAAPSVTATLGPALVLFACALSDYRGLKELGVLAGVGLVFNLLAMLTVFPALLAILPHKWWALADPPRSGKGVLQLVGEFAARRPRTILLGAALLGVAALPLTAQLHVERRLLSTIQPQSMPPVRVQNELERKFGGRDSVVVALVEDTDHEHALARADEWLKEAERLRKAGKLRGYQGVGTLFPAKATQAARRARIDQLDGARIARELRAALEEVGFDTEPFTPFLSQLEKAPPPIELAKAGELEFLVRQHVHDDESGRQVAVLIYSPTPEGLAALRQFAAGPPGGVVTGAPILEDVLRKIVERDTIKVTIASALLVVALLALMYRRWRPFVAVMAPLLLAWIGFGAALAGLGLTLNLFNLLSVPFVIGYGIDDHVFLVHRHDADPSRGPGHTLATTGRAIVLTSLSTMAGFGALIVARFDGLRLLGISGALAVLLCLAAAFAVLPALLALLWKH